MDFNIPEDIVEAFESFKKEQIKKKSGNFTAGERWSYIITPTGLGTMYGIRDNLLEEEKDVTNYDYFG
jgi:hypothetical protein